MKLHQCNTLKRLGFLILNPILLPQFPFSGGFEELYLLCGLSSNNLLKKCLINFPFHKKQTSKQDQLQQYFIF